MVAFFHKLCTTIWVNKKSPVDWVNSIFIPIPKKGDVLQCNNNRTIALISHCRKILLKIISNRMKHKMDEEINKEYYLSFKWKYAKQQQLGKQISVT